jgi:uncharacterized membrane protein YfcA
MRRPLEARQTNSLIAGSMVPGSTVGLILALTGAGGAVVAVPLRLFVLRLDVAEAAPLRVSADLPLTFVNEAAGIDCHVPN